MKGEIHRSGWNRPNQAVYWILVASLNMGVVGVQTDKIAPTRLSRFHLVWIFISGTQDIVWVLTQLLKW